VKPQIKIIDYNYNLPEEKIAKYPLENRDDSKILIFKDNSIGESKFSNLAELLPDNSLLVFNITKVVPARMIFKKESGAIIEIFCLEPYNPSEYNRSFDSKNSCSWIVVIGNAKRWKSGYVLFDSQANKDLQSLYLTAQIEERIDDKFIVRFNWRGENSFSEVMDLCGKVPIPPYLKRDSQALDTERYQTMYATHRGSVAAPTAGLHFTQNVIDEIDKKSIKRENVSLHVGAGTFIPVKSETIQDHKMHSEPFSITINVLTEILEKQRSGLPVISVGTTTTRTLESLYYLGIQCLEEGFPSNVSQWEPYNRSLYYSTEESINALINWMKSESIDTLERRTEIIIVPGYKFRIVDILITNFHQPQSTLLLLISSFIGDSWRDLYNYALSNEFRFLSYGDSSILFRS
jgi:S-adenosylmethionine:tRNA ribosyltransferase-isomerase